MKLSSRKELLKAAGVIIVSLVLGAVAGVWQGVEYGMNAILTHPDMHCITTEEALTRGVGFYHPLTGKWEWLGLGPMRIEDRTKAEPTPTPHPFGESKRWPILN